jgi:hypothetical protein
MEPKPSSLNSQAANRPYPQPDQSNPRPFNVFPEEKF